MIERTSFHRGGNGEPMVLLHGISMSWYFWQPLLADLEAHHDVFAPTLLGHAGGDAWEAGTPLTVTEIVDGVCAVLDEHGIDTAHVVGHSLGGWVALELVRRGRARTAVALSPAGTFRRRFDQVRVVSLFKAGLRALPPERLSDPVGQADWLARHPAIQRAALRGVMEHGERPTRDEVAGFLTDAAGCSMMPDFLAGALEGDGLAPLASLPCPVRVAWSAHDRILPWPNYGAPLRDKLPGAAFHSLPGCGHVPVWDDPELVLRTILQVTAPSAYGTVAGETALAS